MATMTKGLTWEEGIQMKVCTFFETGHGLLTFALFTFFRPFSAFLAWYKVKKVSCHLSDEPAEARDELVCQ